MDAPKVVTVAPLTSNGGVLSVLYARIQPNRLEEVWFSTFGSNAAFALGQLQLALYVVRLYDAPTKY